MKDKRLKELLPDSLKTIATFSDDANYNNLKSSYMKKGSPLLILMAETEKNVQESIRYVQSVNETIDAALPLSIRSGGHGMSGASTNNGGVIIDVSKMNQVEVIDEEKQLVRVQAGADWGRVAVTIAPHDFVITSGNFGDVGVGGLAGSGGIGYFIRSQGLTIDHIQSATLISASGEVIQASKTENPEIFWGIKGGGSQLGIITEFIFRAHKINSPAKDASIIQQSIIYSVNNIAQFVADWGDWQRQAPRKMTSFLMIQKVRQNLFQIRATNVWDGTNPDDAMPELEKALALAPNVDHQEAVIPYPQIIPYPQSRHAGQQQIHIHDALVDKVDYRLGEAIAEAFSHELSVAMELRYIGGAMNDIGTDETAWAARTQEGFVNLWMMPAAQERQDKAFSSLKKLSTGAYGAYSSDISNEVAQLAWPNKTGERLKKLIQELDPTGIFNQGIRLR